MPEYKKNRNLIATGATHWPTLKAAQSIRGRFTRQDLQNLIERSTSVFRAKFDDLEGAALIEVVKNGNRFACYKGYDKYRVTDAGKAIRNAEQLEQHFVQARGGYSARQLHQLQFTID